ncbi:alpha/beta fold hydrolase [Chromohalobacter sp. 11-W]|uniref:alpha/beta fold hydrolase n=1 Tax=Chromohalobacter sp. 11-W TaxID=2994061 RepID=UPI0024694486|nr:alpha/beta fold hydrolase [Chromohalobacter sp. 11-W]
MSESTPPRLVLLSGWGCDARLWQALDGYWSTEVDVETPDWPGYGGRATPDDPASLDELADTMADAMPSDAVWVGWSLGGLLAGALIDRLPPPRALVLLGIGERFPHPQGVSEADLANFRDAFQRHPEAAHARFLRWQLGGEPSPRSAHRRLRAILGDDVPTSPATLAAGLEQLATLDNTSRLAAASCPVHRLVGTRDPLLAPDVLAGADQRIEDAGHCPLLSQPQQLAALLSGIAVRSGARP